MKVRFPDGSHKPTTNVRATHRLLPAAPKLWRSDAFEARGTVWREEPIIGISREGRDVAFLEHLGPGQGYGGGAWPDGVATAFTVRRDGDALVLELWDVEATEPGEFHIPGIDGPA